MCAALLLKYTITLNLFDVPLSLSRLLIIITITQEYDNSALGLGSVLLEANPDEDQVRMGAMCVCVSRGVLRGPVSCVLF